MKKLFTFIFALMAVVSVSAQKRVLVWQGTNADTIKADSITFLSDTYPEFVDLGLPSGTLWADRNLGATTEEGYGGLYAWAMTKPDTVFSSSNYPWTRFNRIKDPKTGRQVRNQWNHYNTIDSLLDLKPTDDAATVAFGSAIHTPTYKQMYELLNECEWTQDTINGIRGYRVTGENGKSIFLPCAGTGVGGKITDVNVCGDYWTSTLPGYNSRYPYELLIIPREEQERHEFSSLTERYRGCSIRPVMDKSK